MPDMPSRTVIADDHVPCRQRNANATSIKNKRRPSAGSERAIRLAPSPTLPPRWEARWKATETAAETLLSRNLSEMQAYYDERSETWQESKQGEAMQARIKAMETVLDVLRDGEG